MGPDFSSGRSGVGDPKPPLKDATEDKEDDNTTEIRGMLGQLQLLLICNHFHDFAKFFNP